MRLVHLTTTGAAALALILRSGLAWPENEYPWVEKLPESIHKVEPAYPPEAQEAGVDGKVVVQVRIIESGKVSETRIIQSIPMLDAAAESAARQWRFRPAHGPDGKPTAVWAAIPFTFKIPAPSDAAHAEFLHELRNLRDLLSGPEMSDPIRPPSHRDEAAREHVIRLARGLKPRPRVLPDVRNLVHRAQAELDSATTESKARALEILSYALYRAPWFAEAYLEAARVLEAAGEPDDAAVALRLYLVADPTSSRRGAIERRLKKLGSNETH